MNKKKVSLISLGTALALAPLAIWAIRKWRNNMNGCCAPDAADNGRKHLFGGMRSKRGHRNAENLEA